MRHFIYNKEEFVGPRPYMKDCKDLQVFILKELGIYMNTKDIFNVWRELSDSHGKYWISYAEISANPDQWKSTILSVIDSCGFVVSSESIVDHHVESTPQRSENKIVSPSEIPVNTIESKKSQEPTGYERVSKGKYYVQVSSYGTVIHLLEADDDHDAQSYAVANYYSDIDVAENNARAENLLRLLRRFSVEHRSAPINWGSDDYVYYIYYGNRLDYNAKKASTKRLGDIYFDSIEAVQEAIKIFKDELLWYFTEYKDSL